MLQKENDEEERKAALRELNEDKAGDWEENFAWYDLRDKDQFFVLHTGDNNCYKKGDQVFHCYGDHNNQSLIKNYGFCLKKNKYESLRFKVSIDFNWKENKNAKETNDKAKIQRDINLKEHRLKDELFAYIRSNLIQEQEKQTKVQSNLLISSPSDPAFEMLVVGCTINLLESLAKSRFTTTIEQDLEIMKIPNLHWRQ
jgi:hypothetical protein